MLKKILRRINELQKSHPFLGFLYGVQKKYGDDQAGYQTALLTYYAFWSLFPLLIVFTTVTQLVLKGNPDLRAHVSNSITNYFPILGNHLQQQVGGSGKTGVALAISLVLTLYGARGVADAFRHAVNHVWRVPQAERLGFPRSVLNSFGLIILGGLGLVGASVVAGYATGGSHALWLRIVSMAITILVLYGILLLLVRLSLAVRDYPLKYFRIAAATGAIGLTILQVACGYLVTHELKNLNTLYGSFAVTLGLLFWLSLQAQVLMYALEANSVRKLNLWPRSLIADEPTKADRRAETSLVQKDKLEADEKIEVNLPSEDDA